MSQHKLNPLISAPPPATVKGLRSWIGAYKHLKACIPGYSSLLSELEDAVAGKESASRIIWSAELTSAFQAAQTALKSPKSITTPRPSDRLVISHDGAVKNAGIGSVMFVMRGDISRLGGYFSAKLTKHQHRWLPCEVEALAISASVNHWGPYILESHHPVQILTDSMPCVQAYQRLKQGKFSNSARVSAFLSTLSRYNVEVKHVSASQNLPADYLSRNPADCQSPQCQICNFIRESESLWARSVSVADILNNKVRMPFYNIPTWIQAQQNCPRLRRVFSHLQQGTRPTNKSSGMRDIKTYLNSVVIGRDGVLVVKSVIPFMPTRNLIVVPEDLLHGLLTALHIQLSHPSANQLMKVFSRHFYAIGSSPAIKSVSDNCIQCSSMKRLPPQAGDFSTSDPPASPGESFACDVMCRARQRIIVMRETLTSYTHTRLLPSERKEHLRSAIIELCIDLKSPQGALVRVDGAPGLKSLLNDPSLKRHGITLSLGRLKNKNKNPVAERAIQELEMELKRISPEGTPVTSTELAVATASLNERIRSRGLSAKEMLFQRDGFTGSQISVEDAVIGDQQYESRLSNHATKASKHIPSQSHTPLSAFSKGDIIFLNDDDSKHKGRERYMVTSLDPLTDMVHIQKLRGSKFQSLIYPVKPSEIYHAPTSSPPRMQHVPGPYDSDHDSVTSDHECDSDKRADIPSPANPAVSSEQAIPLSSSFPTVPASIPATPPSSHGEPSSDQPGNLS